MKASGLLRRSALIFAVLWAASGGGAAFGEWPERALTLVSPLPRNLPWGPNPQAALLEAMVPRLSRELGVPVVYEIQPAGDGVLAANAAALARDEGYVVTALGNDPAVNLVIQGFTPYVWGELTPAATLWRTVYVVVARADYPAEDFRSLAAAQKAKAKSGPEERPRLARFNHYHPATAEIMAMEAAGKAGFAWDLTETDRPDPEVILEGQADAAVLPLADFKTHPHKDEFKVLLVLSEETPRGAEGWPNLKSQSLRVTANTFFALYLPSKANWRVRARLGAAVNNVLRLKAVSEAAREAGLPPYLEDQEGVTPILNQEYANQLELLESFGLSERPGESESAGK